MKLLQENIGSKLFDLGLSNNILDVYSQARETKSKNKQMELDQTKKHLYSKGNYQQNRQAAYWMGEYIWANNISDKGLIFEIYKKPHTTQHQKSKQSNWKMGRGPEKTSFQKRHRDANRHMERSSILFIIREMQFKTMMKCHLTLVRMSIIKKTSNNKCGQECEERGTLIHFWWECRLCSPLWKTVWRYLKKRCGFHFPLPASVRLSPPWLQKDAAFLNAHCSPVAALPSPPLPGLSPPAIQVTRAWTPVSFLHLWSDLWLCKLWTDKLLGGTLFPTIVSLGKPTNWCREGRGAAALRLLSGPSSSCDPWLAV